VLQVGKKGRVWLQVPKAGELQRFELWQLDFNQLPGEGHAARVIPLD